MSEPGIARHPLAERRSRTIVTQSANGNLPDDDQAMLALAVEWIPLGGPKEDDIWARFGFGPMPFWHRICYLLTRPKWLQLLNATTITELQDQAMTQFNPPRRLTSPHQTLW
ncbi:DUF3263 domain-containing protein [Rhodococcus sp. T2V]|uniref:DUF3263 domain-containing protein n=1 Tax=Rhodococcus sp. T2V TaxID=3034164 RepID=UPI0023E20384|nr:DUF3263 domain-containing protein [Rhodococcus sp. T2V]MDF3306771.1 DUF3263 domain-containing protein [Rhodococcus sp. T2V]